MSHLTREEDGAIVSGNYVRHWSKDIMDRFVLRVARPEASIPSRYPSNTRSFASTVAISVVVLLSIVAPVFSYSLASNAVPSRSSPERATINDSIWTLSDQDSDIPISRRFAASADPTDLTAAALSVGMNGLAWNGNNEMGTVIYEVWRLQGDTEPFRLIAVTKKQVYLDRSVAPGAYYNYKVRAVAPKSVSNFSNTAVVYGAS